MEEKCKCSEKIEKIIKKLQQEKKSESDELNELFSALAKAQLEMEVAKPTSRNPFFKSNYADLASIIKASRKHLSVNGLSVIQRILTNGDGKMYLYTRLCHISGQWIESKMPVNPAKGDIQSIGSYLTYLKRYNYAAMVGVVSSEEDDDGEKAMNRISEEQLRIITNELKGFPELKENILKGYHIKKLEEIDARKFNKCLSRIKEIKEKKDV